MKTCTSLWRARDIATSTAYWSFTSVWPMMTDGSASSSERKWLRRSIKSKSTTVTVMEHVDYMDMLSQLSEKSSAPNFPEIQTHWALHDDGVRFRHKPALSWYSDLQNHWVQSQSCAEVFHIRWLQTQLPLWLCAMCLWTELKSVGAKVLSPQPLPLFYICYKNLKQVQKFTEKSANIHVLHLFSFFTFLKGYTTKHAEVRQVFS